MSSSFNFIDHTADIAVEVKADSLEELFIASALAFKETLFEPDSIISKEHHHLKLNSHSLESLLVNFLNELNFRLTFQKKIVNNIVDIKVYQTEDNWNLECTLQEGEVEEDKIKTEIKSVTYHQMDLRKTDEGYKTIIVFDI